MRKIQNCKGCGKRQYAEPTEVYICDGCIQIMKSIGASEKDLSELRKNV